MKIDSFLTPFFPEKEKQFDDVIVLMVDVLRASTTICTALHNGAKEVIPCESLDKAVQIYSNLSKEVRFLGGERNGEKPSGFDAGNSPFEYTEENVAKKNVVLTTSNGTKTFQQAKNAKIRLIAGFVNLNSVLAFLEEKYLKDNEDQEICILCAGTNGRLSYEDTLCCGAIIKLLKMNHKNVQLTDTADAAKNLYNLHSVDLQQFLKTKEHAVFLKNLGFEKDVDLALTFDKFPVVPYIEGSSIRKFTEDN